ncbi:MAG: hypothetical protein ACQEUM_18270 [Pseudomonadota bacterium]
MTKPLHFEVGQPMPLGHRQTVNQADDAEMEKALDLLAEKLAPLVAELLEGEAPKGDGMAANGSNGRRIPPQDQWDTLPPGDDQWAGVDLNDAIDGRNDRKPGTLDEYGFPDELRGDLDAYQLPD